MRACCACWQGSITEVCSGVGLGKQLHLQSSWQSLAHFGVKWHGSAQPWCTGLPCTYKPARGEWFGTHLQQRREREQVSAAPCSDSPMLLKLSVCRALQQDVVFATELLAAMLALDVGSFETETGPLSFCCCCPTTSFTTQRKFSVCSPAGLQVMMLAPRHFARCSADGRELSLYEQLAQPQHA